MTTRALLPGTIVMLLIVAGCSAPAAVHRTDTGVVPRKTIAFEVSQIREYDASKRQAFDATQTVMENAGYVIDIANYETGVLNGKAPIVRIDRLLLTPISKSVTASALVDGGPESRTRVQIDFVSTVDAPKRVHGNGLFVEEKGVSDLVTYQRVFDEIEEMLSPGQL